MHSNVARLWKVVATIIAVLVLVPIAILFFFFFLEVITTKYSEIVDFKPTSFPGKANSNFFYSIGNELKYSDQIDSDAPTLFSARFVNYLVSPDGRKIAVVANDMLQIVGGDGSIKHVNVPVNSIFVDSGPNKKPKPIGVQFFRDDHFQWSKDSKSLYLIKDEYYESKGLQLHSTKGELWRYEIDTGKLQLVLRPFPAGNYFIGRNSGVYFSSPDSAGDLQLKYFDGNSTRDIDKPHDRDISVDQFTNDNRESIFYSFDIHDYEQAILPSKGGRLIINNDGKQDLMIGSKVFLEFTLGKGSKGPYYCSEMFRSVFLPGDRYFMFNVYCGNYAGQLLIDTANGSYKILPKDTSVYLASNTNNFQNYRITEFGLEQMPTPESFSQAHQKLPSD